jgi:uncharacterized membrane protein
MNVYLLIIMIGLAGFSLAFYMFQKKRKKDMQFVCPLRGNCSDVIHSRYSAFFGIPVEALGLLYYFCILLGYSVLLFFPSVILPAVLKSLLLLASTFALVFSFYLTFIQFASLKKICTWCLLSASFCLCIFLLSVRGSSEIALPLFLQWKEGIQLLFILSMAFGLSSSFFSLLFFHKFLSDFKLSKEESSVLDGFSQAIWLSIGLILMSGFALLFSEKSTFSLLSIHFLQVILFGVIVVCNTILSLKAAPNYIDLVFSQNIQKDHPHLQRIRRLVFVIGPVMVCTWFAVFFLSSVHVDQFDFAQALIGYVFVVSVAAYFGIIAESHTQRSAMNNLSSL